MYIYLILIIFSRHQEKPILNLKDEQFYFPVHLTNTEAKVVLGGDGRPLYLCQYPGFLRPTKMR